MGKKLTDQEFMERHVYPSMERLHAQCSKRGISMFFMALAEDGHGCEGIVVSDKYGELLPQAGPALSLQQHNEMLRSGLHDKIGDILSSLLEKPDDGEDGVLGVGHEEVQA